MTRILSELLQAQEPEFQLHLRKLEDANGAPSADVRLTAELLHTCRHKLQALQLDPDDTTGPELYAALKERLTKDEERLTAALKKLSPNTNDAVSLVARGLKSLPFQVTAFSLKPAAAKRLMKAANPKKTMKALGYRSLDSMLKHEPIQLVYAAAWISESAQWAAKLVKAYRKLSAHDFESRPLTIDYPTSKRWQKFGESVTARRKHHVFSFKELGSIVLLPLPQSAPAYRALTTAVLCLQAMNEIQASSTFLKLHQLKSSFGQTVEKSMTQEPVVSSHMFDRSVPWRIIQQYYARLSEEYTHDIFEPYIQAEDLAWQPVEKVLTYLEPSLAFWEDSAHLGLLHDHKPVSLNIADALLSHCNNLPFQERLSSYLQHSLWHELMLRYFKHERVEQAVLDQLEPEQAYEPALV